MKNPRKKKKPALSREELFQLAPVVAPIAVIGVAGIGIYLLFRRLEPWVTGYVHQITDNVEEITGKFNEAADQFEDKTNLGKITCKTNGKTFRSFSDWQKKGRNLAVAFTMSPAASAAKYAFERRKFEKECKSAKQEKEFKIQELEKESKEQELERFEKGIV